MNNYEFLIIIVRGQQIEIIFFFFHFGAKIHQNDSDLKAFRLLIFKALTESFNVRIKVSSEASKVNSSDNILALIGFNVPEDAISENFRSRF